MDMEEYIRNEVGALVRRVARRHLRAMALVAHEEAAVMVRDALESRAWAMTDDSEPHNR